MGKRDARPAGPRSDDDLIEPGYRQGNATKRQWRRALKRANVRSAVALRVALDFDEWFDELLMCHRTVAQIADELGVPSRSIEKAIELLIGLGLIRKVDGTERDAFERRKRSRSGRALRGRKATVYCAIFPPVDGKKDADNFPAQGRENEKPIFPPVGAPFSRPQAGPSSVEHLKDAGAPRRAPTSGPDQDYGDKNEDHPVSDITSRTSPRAPEGARGHAPDLNDQTEPAFDQDGLLIHNAADMERPPDYRPPDWPQDHVSADLPPGAICGPLALACFDQAFTEFRAANSAVGVDLAAAAGFAALFLRGFVEGDRTAAAAVTGEIVTTLGALGAAAGNAAWPHHRAALDMLLFDVGVDPATGDLALEAYLDAVKTTIAQPAQARARGASHATGTF